MFIFAGRKCRSSESKRNLLPGARLLGEAIADYVTAKKSNNIAVDPKIVWLMSYRRSIATEISQRCFF